MELAVTIYGIDGAVIPERSPANNTGVYFLGCEARAPLDIRGPMGAALTHPAPPPRARSATRFTKFYS